MSTINGFNFFDKSNSGIIHNQPDVDEIFGEKAHQKSKTGMWNPNEKSAVYEPSKKEKAPVTYQKPVSVIKNTNNTKNVELSDAAKALLEELQEKYQDTDFIIANYSSDEEADALMAGGTKEYTVLIEPEILEQMAADESVKDQYLSQIDTAKNEMTSMLEKLNEEGKNVESVGVSIKADGTISYFAKMREEAEEHTKELEEELKERREEKTQEKKEKEKERLEEKLQPPVKTYTVSADSIEELLEKIKNS